MQRYFVPLVIIVVLASLMTAQQKPKSQNAVAGARPSEKAETTPGLPAEETVNSFLQQMFGYDPSISWKINSIKPSEAQGLAEVTVILAKEQGQQSTVLYVTQDGKHALVGEILPFGARPFAAAKEQLQKGVNGISRGPANAPATIVEFSDLQCPHCKAGQPAVEKLLADEPNARFVFQPFPLPSHDWAAKAAAFGDCVGRANNAAFWKFVNAVYNAQSDITQANADEKLTAIATDAGTKGTDIAACAAKPETKARIDRSVELGKAVDVTGTPTLFINGRKIANIGGTPPDVLKGMVDFAAKEVK
ncbi:MAG TPA: thioredoxin domain-containing protein [Terriglobales bacterium]|nr:thioredoxin domain-containing protein [Terriglobales bacterium]